MNLVETETTTVTKTVSLEKGEVNDLLNELYKNIWMEGFYDPDFGLESQKFARKLWPSISKLNEMLKFRR